MKPDDQGVMGLLRMRGLLLRSTLVVIFVSLLASLAAVAYTAYVTHQRAHKAAQIRLNELLDTVQSTLQVASFAKDHTLAGELAEGLLSNSEVLAVTITSEKQVLAKRQRKQADTAITADKAQPVLALKRLIYSPFDNQKEVGYILLAPDPGMIEARIKEEVRFAAIQLSWQLAMVAFAVALVMLLFIVRPIKAMSDQLHSMDPTTGERLPIPRRHGHTEIGQLVNDINALANRLVSVLAAEHHLRLAREIDERKYHAIFDNAESGIFILDNTGSLLSWNAAFGRLFEISQSGSADDLAWINIGMLAWDNPEQINHLTQSALSRTGSVSQDLLIRLPDGKRRWAHIVLSPVGENLLQGVVHDVTPHKEAEASARQLVVTDPLTGLANRLGLEAGLHGLIQEYALPQSGGFTLLLLNLDEFRGINEGMGLPAGDSILQTTSSRLSNCVKNGDIIARLSADSFGIILNQMTQADVADRICNRILAAIRQTYFVNGTPINLHASIGITRFPLDAGDVPNLLRQAELAMDSAKSGGGNTHVFFDPILAEAAEHRRQLQNDLRAAIQNHELVMFYQPIIDLRTHRLAGAETLIRWRHPKHGMVMPDSFIPLAEKTGLIIDIGLFVLDAACRQLRSWQDQGLDYTLSVNVSGSQIPDGLSPARLQEVITHHGISPGRLALEITEGVMLHDIEKSLHWLNAVHAMGLRIYLDDFGTGFSSLSYLKRFPIDTLKIDKSFVRDMRPDNNEHTLVGAIIAMGRSLGLQIVAEGVELPSHLTALGELGCDYAQGFYFSRPVPAEEFATTATEIAALLAKPAA
jgi:diguanylate cyclase (GGDEF)-like protein/PAS domain S-box-containing protein